MTGPSAEPGSFRDRTSRVFYAGGAVLRGLDTRALGEWEALAATRFFPELLREGKVVGTERLEAPGVSGPDGVTRWAGVLRHDRVPFVSFPYEWCFGMLKDAALLQLELLETALGEGMILKDSTPFNVQWRGARPVFIDVASFERLRPGEPWAGYRQFCEMFLYPLLLQAYRNVAFQPWLRGRIDGIEAAQCWSLMSARDLLRPGVLAHVYLQAKAQARFADTVGDVRADLRAAGFHAALITANIRRLTRLVRRLRWRQAVSPWSEYTTGTSYAAPEREEKAAFVERVVSSRPWKLVWDLGCNTGTFSRVAARHGALVVAMDADHLVIERLYQQLKREGTVRILPLVSNVADPSPRLGWRGMERGSLSDRGRPDLSLCLALIHHLAIAANVPVREIIEWLRSLGGALVIEFPTKEDPMVRRLLQNKRDDYADYDRGHFEGCLKARFDVLEVAELAGGTRILYFAAPRGSA
jgi:SAM-dependent methyltransferase